MAVIIPDEDLMEFPTLKLSCDRIRSEVREQKLLKAKVCWNELANCQPGILKKLKDKKSSSQIKCAKDSPMTEDSSQRAFDFTSEHWQKLCKRVGSCDIYITYDWVTDWDFCSSCYHRLVYRRYCFFLPDFTRE